MYKKSIFNKLFLTLVFSCPAIAWAAGTAVLTGDGSDTGELVVMWLDNGAMRVNPDASNPSNYMLLKDNNIYSVGIADGEVMVMEMGGMLKALGSTAMSMGGDNISIPVGVESVKDTGKTETIAGIEGTVYTLTTIDANGKTETDEAVLTDDKLVTELTMTYLNSMLPIFDQNSPEKFIDALPNNRRGLLRYGGDFRLVSITDDAPDAKDFELPAPPTDFTQMLKALQMAQ